VQLLERDSTILASVGSVREQRAHIVAECLENVGFLSFLGPHDHGARFEQHLVDGAGSRSHDHGHPALDLVDGAEPKPIAARGCGFQQRVPILEAVHLEKKET